MRSTLSAARWSGTIESSSGAAACLPPSVGSGDTAGLAGDSAGFESRHLLNRRLTEGVKLGNALQLALGELATRGDRVLVVVKLLNKRLR